MRNFIMRITLGAIVSLSAAVSAHAQFDRSASILADYMELLKTDNYETANLMWSEADQERAARFGIVYVDIPLKIDASSVVVRNLDQVASLLDRPARSEQDLKDGYAKLVYTVVVDGSTLEQPYYMMQDHDWYWLVFPQDYFSRHWPVVESQYFRVHYNPGLRGNIAQPFLDEADALLDQLARQLKLGHTVLKQIEKDKIEFFYCATEDEVTDITGHQTRGTVDLGSNDVISASFPHLHELTHLLTAIKIGSQHLYTLPLFREGLAVALGGRWGKGVEPLMDLARFLKKNKYVELDSILTMPAFDDNTGADFHYPLAGLFSRWLVDERGLDEYLAIYRSFSGGFDGLYRMTPQDVKDSLTARLGYSSWDELQTAFDTYIDNGMQEYIVSGYGIDPGSRSVKLKDGLDIEEDRDYYSFSFDMSDTTIHTVTLLLDSVPDIGDAVSTLYEEHFGPSRPYDGSRLAVRFDRAEAGLYSYLSNRILAKYIVGISDDKIGGYNNPETGIVSFHFSRRLFGGINMSSVDMKLVVE